MIAETFGKASRIASGVGPHAAGDDHPAVLVHRLADRGERFRFRAVEKAAGVDDDRVRAGVAARKLVALGAQPRENALAVDERLRAAERDEGNARRGAVLGLGDVGHARQLPRARRGGKDIPPGRAPGEDLALRAAKFVEADRTMKASRWQSAR